MNPAQILTDVALPGPRGAAAQRALLELLGKLAKARLTDEDEQAEVAQEVCWRVYKKALGQPVIDTLLDGVAVSYLKRAVWNAASSMLRRKDPLRAVVNTAPQEEETESLVERQASGGPGPDDQTDRREAESTFAVILDPVLERVWERGRAANRELEWRSAWAEVLSLFKEEATVDDILQSRGIIPISAPDLKTQRNNIHKAHQYLRDRLIAEAEGLLADGTWDAATCLRAKELIRTFKRNSGPVSAARKERPLKKGGTQ